MSLPKTIDTKFGDVVKIDVDEDADVAVTLNARTAYLTPEQARRLAKAIKKAAKRAEAAL